MKDNLENAQYMYNNKFWSLSGTGKRFRKIIALYIPLSVLRYRLPIECDILHSICFYNLLCLPKCK